MQQHPAKVEAIIQNAYHELPSHGRPRAISREQKKLVQKADPELLIKHGRLPDAQWQKVWDSHLAETQQDLLQLLKSANPSEH